MTVCDLLLTAIISFASSLAANAVYDLIRYILSDKRKDKSKD